MLASRLLKVCINSCRVCVSKVSAPHNVLITVAPGRGGVGPHPGLTGARPSPPPPSPAPPRGLTRDAPSRGGSSLPDPRAPHTRRLRAGHAHAAPYAYRAPPAHQRHAPRRGRAARAAPPLTQNNTNYKSTKRVTPLYSAQTVRTAPNAQVQVSDIYRGARKKRASARRIASLCLGLLESPHASAA